MTERDIVISEKIVHDLEQRNMLLKNSNDITEKIQVAMALRLMKLGLVQIKLGRD